MPIELIPIAPDVAAGALEHPGFARLRPAAPFDADARLVVADGHDVALVVFDQLDHEQGTSSLAWYPLPEARITDVRALAVAAVDHGFAEHALELLWCEVVDEELAATLQDLGFRVEGRFRRHVKRGDTRVDALFLSLSRRDWATRRPLVARRLEDPDAPRGRFEPGDAHEVAFRLGADDLRAFAELTGDRNPIHLDDDAARTRGFDARIAHGMLTAAVFSRVLGTDFPGEGTVYVRQDLRFLRPVYPDRPLTARLEVTRKVGRWLTLRTTVADDGVGAIVVDGEAEVIVPA